MLLGKDLLLGQHLLLLLLLLLGKYRASCSRCTACRSRLASRLSACALCFSHLLTTVKELLPPLLPLGLVSCKCLFVRVISILRQPVLKALLPLFKLPLKLCILSIHRRSATNRNSGRCCLVCLRC